MRGREGGRGECEREEREKGGRGERSEGERMKGGMDAGLFIDLSVAKLL